MRKIWNHPDWPVWSISTRSPEGRPNLNIATYVNVVSLSPKLITLAVYNNTKTLENLMATDSCLLQLLTESLAPVVRICGRETGKKVDKVTKLKKRYDLEMSKEGFYYFTEAIGYTILRIVDRHEVPGDHVLITGEVMRSKNGRDAKSLTTGYLRAKNYIR